MRKSLFLHAAALCVALSTTSWAGAFEKTLSKEGITFRIHAANDSSVGTVTIAPKGLSIDNTPVKREIDGVVTGAQIADLNGDGAPEIYLFVHSAGSGAYGTVIGYSSNRNKSMSEIYLPELNPNAKEARGYMGHDRFKIKGKYLLRSFPIYRKDDPNCCPSGGTRTLYYTLAPGEAMWQLKLVKSEETTK